MLMKICSALLELLYFAIWDKQTDRQTDVSDLIGAFLQLIIVNVP
jgi:hypothetical protein